VSRNLLRTSLLSLVMFSSALSASAAPTSGISFAEAPVRLVRDTSMFTAVRGARLQNGDLIETGASAIQLEGMGGATVAIGPGSRAYFKIAGSTVEITLLSGWLKVQAGAAPSTTINAGTLRVNPEGSSLIFNAAPGKTAVFVETGAPSVAEIQGAKQLRATKLAREQYAMRTTKEALKVLPRPPKEFLSGMPPAFFDQLVPVSFKGAAPAPKLERPAVFASDVAPWLADDAAVFQVLNRRFNPPPKRSTATPAAPEKPAPRDTPIY
jgi:hypothetical protein